VGRAYGGGRWFDRGIFAGKRAMCSLTIGGPSSAYSEQGIYGPLSPILFPIHHGIFGFVGFTVIEPFVVHGPVRMSDEERVTHLARYRERVLNLASAPTITGPKTSDYDGLVLKSASRPLGR
jgi:NAD(P)H dehydrogenase (quinone)